LDNIKRLRAVQYVRMSTEHQKYSTLNQEKIILEYASQYNMDVVHTYKDHGKSGLKISGRDALQQLIKDVESGSAGFDVILVYDISRWGRFQDADESAYYEYICKRANIQVHYCAEQFNNDGSPVSTIVKGVKRAMAGEYSRELSTKVFAGQCRLIEMGYRQGGAAGYGLRRLLLDEKGEPLRILKRGERKSVLTERVILVLGPDQEVENVKLIYRWFIDESLKEGEIAKKLNEKGLLTDYDRAWTRGTVKQILTNEKYIGNNLYNRQSYKLKKTHVINPPDIWVRKDGAFDAIINPKDFYTVQGIIQERYRRYSDDDLLEGLGALYKKQGLLSSIIINESEELPSSNVYTNRFGSLIRAYKLVGYIPDRDYRYLEINKRLRKLSPQVIDNVKQDLEIQNCHVELNNKSTLNIESEISASLIIARHKGTPSGQSQWKIHFDRSETTDIIIVARMAPDNKNIKDYYILPSLENHDAYLRFSEDNGLSLDAYRFDDLSFFYQLTERTSIYTEAA
jgi:DNA invertase Pin-like site-specific DNA recombinase